MRRIGGKWLSGDERASREERARSGQRAERRLFFRESGEASEFPAWPVRCARDNRAAIAAFKPAALKSVTPA